MYSMHAKYILIVMSLLVVGCGSCKPVVVKDPVYVPTKCDITPIARPRSSGDIVQDMKNILEYTEIIEQDLHCCSGGDRCMKKK